MLGLRSSAGILSDISLRLLRNVSFHGLRVQGIRIGNTEIPSNKRLAVALQHIHGIGRCKAHQILGELRMENKLAKDLTGKEVMDLREEVNRYEHGEELRRHVNAEIQRLVDIQCYRGIRHTQGLPCRGQRTKTNARTLKNKGFTVAGMKKASAR